MSEVTLNIGGHPYTVSCEAGQESHIEKLGSMIEGKLESMEQLSPQRSQNLLFAALFLADDLHEASKNANSSVDFEQELATLRSAQTSAQSELHELQLERDALLSERDSMRADHDAVKAELADTKSEITELNAAIASAPDTTESTGAVDKLADLADALEKCATELERRVSAP